MKPSEAIKQKKSVYHQKAEEAWEKGANFFNGRNPREKMMIIAFAACLIVFLDYWVLIHPVVQVFRDTLPNLAVLEADAESYRTDQKNREPIERACAEAQNRIMETENGFVAPDGLPALLENLSKQAQESGVKILSLRTGEAEEAGQTRRYSSVPIRISAVAGTHNLGKFLARLESGRTFFKVLDLKVAAQSSDPKRHLIDTTLQVYRRAS